MFNIICSKLYLSINFWISVDTTAMPAETNEIQQKVLKISFSLELQQMSAQIAEK
jgi:hypothetical protein